MYFIPSPVKLINIHVSASLNAIIKLGFRVYMRERGTLRIHPDKQMIKRPTKDRQRKHIGCTGNNCN